MRIHHPFEFFAHHSLRRLAPSLALYKAKSDTDCVCCGKETRKPSDNLAEIRSQSLPRQAGSTLSSDNNLLRLENWVEHLDRGPQYLVVRRPLWNKRRRHNCPSRSSGSHYAIVRYCYPDSRRSSPSLARFGLRSLRDCHLSSGSCRSVAAKGRFPGSADSYTHTACKYPTDTLDTRWGPARVPKTGRRRK